MKETGNPFIYQIRVVVLVTELKGRTWSKIVWDLTTPLERESPLNLYKLRYDNNIINI